MRHRLPRVRPIIGDNAKATGQKPLLLSDSSRQRQRIGHDLGITGLMGSQRRNMASRNDQDMYRRLRSQVPKRDAVRALGHKLSAQLAARNATKDAIIKRCVRHAYSTVPSSIQYSWYAPLPPWMAATVASMIEYARTP